MTIFAVHYTYDSRSEVRDRVRPEHRRFLTGLNQTGQLLASGPFTGPTVAGPGRTVGDETSATSTPGTSGAASRGDESPAEGTTEGSADGALLLVRADSLEAVWRTLDEDPFWVQDLISARSARPWSPVIGAFA